MRSDTLNPNYCKDGSMAHLHPLDQLTVSEVNLARTVIESARHPHPIVVRNIVLEEPPKKKLLPYLDAENEGASLKELSSLRPPRLARCIYDVIIPGCEKETFFYDSLVDLDHCVEVEKNIVKGFHAPLNAEEIEIFPSLVTASSTFQDAVKELNLPSNTKIVVDPWMYGGSSENDPRLMQGLIYARDPGTNNPDSNHYAFPLPIIPVVDMKLRKVVRIDRLATGGTEDGLKEGTRPKRALDHCKPSEYIPELVEGGLRSDLKPLNVIQPQGPSFSVVGSQIKWQKWSFRVGFNPREGATIHDIRFEGRSIFYRLSFSEMSVPYGDPRAPFHRKQAFDFGDGGAGRAANNLQLGCDCLGLIKYFDAVMTDTSGKGAVYPNVICLHEQDSGIGWKHTNYRTGRAVVTRNRQLVVQFIITLANYEYIFAYIFDQAGGITLETRASGIVSTVPIDPGKTSPYGDVVSPGVLAQNHQHLFCVRIDPAIDGQKNTVIQEESHPIPWTPEENPYGHGYMTHQTAFEKSGFADAAPQHNRIFKIINRNKRNPISGRPVAYKFTPSSSQLQLAHPGSLMARRSTYASHHVWVTKYRDGEFYASGRWTNQSAQEVGGVADMAARNDDVDNEDIVVWHSFGLTHNPRTEDFPVMPAEIHQISFKPSDFFTRNPAIDVPSQKNLSSMLYENTPAMVNKLSPSPSFDVGCCKLPNNQASNDLVVMLATGVNGKKPVSTGAGL